MATITINTANDTFDDVSFDETTQAMPVLKWLAGKYGVSLEHVTFAELMTHMAVMAIGNEYLGWNTDNPQATSGDDYDDLHNEITSLVIVHVSS